MWICVFSRICDPIMKKSSFPCCVCVCEPERQLSVGIPVTIRVCAASPINKQLKQSNPFHTQKVFNRRPFLCLYTSCFIDILFQINTHTHTLTIQSKVYNDRSSMIQNRILLESLFYEYQLETLMFFWCDEVCRALPISYVCVCLIMLTRCPAKTKPIGVIYTYILSISPNGPTLNS